MRWTSWLVSGSLAVGLGCSGLTTSVPPRAHVEAVCAVAPFAGVSGLASTDRPPQAPVGMPWRIDGPLEPEMSALAQASNDPMVLVAPASTPAAIMLEALRALEGPGVAVIVVDSAVDATAPPLPDPAYAATLRETMADPDTRMMAFAKEMERLLALCPPGIEVFEAIAVASPDVKCLLLAAGMEEALPMCPLTDGDQVLTAIQVALGPEPGAKLPSTITLRYAPDGVPLDLGAGTWGDVARAVSALDGQAVALPPR